MTARQPADNLSTPATASACNPDIIENFLADRLTENEQADFERHLDECDHCCAALQAQVVDVNFWNETRNYLSSVDGFGDEASSDTAGQAFDPQRLDFLAATDDPRMLGRFGGYEISGVIGCGGMGIVLKGFDAALNRYAAIKPGQHSASGKRRTRDHHGLRTGAGCRRRQLDTQWRHRRNSTVHVAQTSSRRRH